MSPGRTACDWKAKAPAWASQGHLLFGGKVTGIKHANILKQPVLGSFSWVRPHGLIFDLTVQICALGTAMGDEQLLFLSG